MLRSIVVKEIFTDKSRAKDIAKKTIGMNISFASKFIASNKTM